MESLVTVVVMMLFIVVLSAPINLALTTRRVQLIAARHLGLTAIRRILISLVGTCGIVTAAAFIHDLTALGPKLFAMTAIGGNFYALKREKDFWKSEKDSMKRKNDLAL